MKILLFEGSSSIFNPKQIAQKSYSFQAKKTKTTSNNYRGITYPNEKSTQMRKLISDAYSNNAIPIYAYYTNKIDIIFKVKDIF